MSTPREPLALTDGALALEGVSLEALAEAHGTPLYAYAAGNIDRAFDRVDASLGFAPHLIAYAVKANGNLALLSRLAARGAGADIVSIGELERALRAGFPPDRIVFSGVGKRDDEIRRALEVGIRSIHLESAPEADAVARVARDLGTVAKVSIRVNPNVDPKTHPYIATGIHGTKFGLEMDEARRLADKLRGVPSVVLEGLAAHIGSQVSALDAMEQSARDVAALFVELRGAGHPMASIDTGGGWPIPYGNEQAPHPPAEEFGAALERGLGDGGVTPSEVHLVVEPGRYLIGPAGVLVTRVVFVKEQGGKRFVIVDAAMNDLLRPALYRAHHEVLAVRPRQGAESPANIVGPVCETGDFFALDRALGPVERGDLVVVRDVGAYGMAMSGHYNSRPRPAEVLVEGGAARVIRDREQLADLWRGEHA
ncbi:MAG: diaminopimelate decarboxylase [Polyangiales bacterium]